jgi:Helix-turn-helix domain
MAERLRFVARRLAGEPMVELCREFAISRKTGYQIFDRYKESGLEALTDHSRGPWRYANQLSQQVDPGHEVPPGKSMPPHPAPVAGCRNSLIRFTTKTIQVTCCGRICLHRKKINLSTAVGIKEVEEGIWLVSFMDYDPGCIDLEEKTVQPLDNPFGPKV